MWLHAVDKLRWLLSKATATFGNTPVSELQPAAIAAWRMTIAYGHRFEATQALRQTLSRAVQWRMINRNPAKQASRTAKAPASSNDRSSPGTSSTGSPNGSADT